MTTQLISSTASNNCTCYPNRFPRLHYLCCCRYLRGEIREVALDSLSDRQTRDSHYELYRRTRRNALALWCEIIGMQAPTAARDSSASTSGNSWPEGGEGGAPCLLWCSGSWHCATACRCVGPEKEAVKVGPLGGNQWGAYFLPAVGSTTYRYGATGTYRSRNYTHHGVIVV